MAHRACVVADGILPVDVEVDALILVEVLGGLAEVLFRGRGRGSGAPDDEREGCGAYEQDARGDYMRAMVLHKTPFLPI
jgi:hypothetical protein